MVKVVGVRFRTEGKVYFFDPRQLEIKRGDNVIVETAGGYEFGRAVSGIREVEEEAVVQPLKPILRIANERDLAQEQQNKEKEKEAFKICQEKIKKHGLEMKLIDADYAFDNSKLLFHFTADGRVDFRELVKDLAAIFKTRIELRQIGVRDETRFLGGIGICGRPLCCCTYLTNLDKTVSIKMAKEQNLSLNPTKISGACGRLMCCLRNEEETYEELNKRLPNVGDYVVTPDGQKGEVHSVNVLRQLVKVLVGSDDDKELKEFEVDRLKFRRQHGKKDKQDLSPEELKELEKLEREEEEEMEAAMAAEEGAAKKKEGGRNSQKGRDKNARGEKADRQKGDSEGRADNRNRSERNERQNQDRSERNERQNQDRSERNDRSTQEKPDRNERQNRFENKSDKGERRGQDRSERNDRQGRGDKAGRGDRQNQDRNFDKNQDRNQEKRDRSEGRRDRQGHGDKQFHGRGDGAQNKPYRDKNRFGNRQDQNGQQGNRPKDGQKQQSGEE